MAKETPKDERNSIEALNDHLTNIEQRVQNNQRLIMWLCIGVAAVVLLVFGYMYGIHRPAVAASDNAIGKADTELRMGNDSVATELYKQVAAQHGHDAGNRANLNAAILLYQQGEYEQALTYLKKYSTKDDLVGAGALSLQGDCYVNLDQYKEAVGAYRKAAKASDNNPYYTPYFMFKEATVLHELEDYKGELAVYEAIDKDYPQYCDDNRIDITKYIERARTMAGN